VVGVGFLFAPALHGAMKHTIGPRREIGIRTIFNILGPLTNPAGADRQVLGVYDEKLVEVLAKVLVKLGCQRGFVVHGQDGMDEITLTGPTRIAEINEGKVALSTIEPEDFGLRRCLLTDLQGGDAEENAAIVKDVLAGAEGPKRDVVLLNAAYALIAAGIVESVDAGLQKARNVIDEGLAKAKLEGLVNLTNA
jgi:anthranilate phosphoribosyltransferase